MIYIGHWFKTRTAVAYGDGFRGLGWPPYEDKLWQSGFMDLIIRSEQALQRLRQYIENNPSQWDGDALHPTSSPIHPIRNHDSGGQ